MEPIPEKIKKDIFEKLSEFKTIYLSTAEGDRPRVRPVTLCLVDKKLFVLTNSQSPKMEQIRNNPNFEATLPLNSGENSGYIRFSGTASEVTDAGSKKAAAEAAPYFSMYWKGVKDPTYTLMKLDLCEVEYMKPGDFAGTNYKF